MAAIALIGATGNSASCIDPRDILFRARVDQSALDEAISGGVLVLTEAGLVMLGESLLIQETRRPYDSESPNPATVRVRRYRASKAAERAAMQAMPQLPGLLTEVTPVTPPPVVPTPVPSTAKTPVALHAVPELPTPADSTREKTIGSTLASAASAAQTSASTTTGLIFPESFSPVVCKDVQKNLAGLTHDQAQLVLDEIAGKIEAGKKIFTPTGLARLLAERELAGTFNPEYAHAVAERREMAAKAVQRQRELVKESPAISLEEVRSAIMSNPDPVMRRFLLERLDSIGKVRQAA
ncbi:MAG: hypothetical protein HQL80_11630 [Magnetococcales bacterium]|nr:hypothetical protein [Magnetococcales bacterium]